MRALEQHDSTEDYSSGSSDSESSEMQGNHPRDDSESEDSEEAEDSAEMVQKGFFRSPPETPVPGEEPLMSRHFHASEKQTPPPLPKHFTPSSGAVGGFSPPPLPVHDSNPQNSSSLSVATTAAAGGSPKKSRRLEQELQELENRMKAKYSATSNKTGDSGVDGSSGGLAAADQQQPPPPIPRTSTMSGISRSATSSQFFRSNPGSPLQQRKTLGASSRSRKNSSSPNGSIPRPPSGSMPAPPQPWTTQVHPETNVVYFYNPETGKSQWHFPSEHKEATADKEKEKEDRKAKSGALQKEVTDSTKDENRAASVFSQHAREEETFRELQKVWEEKAKEHRNRADLIGKDLDGLAVEERLEEALQLLKSVQSARKEAEKQSKLALKATEQKFMAAVELSKARRRRLEAERNLQNLKEEEDLEHFQQQQQLQQQYQHPLHRHSSSGSLQSLRRSSAENSPHSSFHRLDGSEYQNYHHQQQHSAAAHHRQYSHSQSYPSQEFSSPVANQQFQQGSPSEASGSPARLHVIEKMIKGLPEGSELRMENGNLIVYKDGQWLGDIKVDDVHALEAELSAMVPGAGMNLIPDETTKGLALASVIPGGAAAFAGLSPGEVITHINDQKVQDEQTFRDIWNQVRPGDLLRLVILRSLQPGTRRYSRRTALMCVGARGHSVEEVQALCVLIAKARGLQIPQFPPRQQPRGSPGSPSVAASSHNLRDYRK